jgi:hypothetical protein
VASQIRWLKNEKRGWLLNRSWPKTWSSDVVATNWATVREPSKLKARPHPTE